jgi:hypothetical protein
MNNRDICLIQNNPDLGMNTKLPDWIQLKNLCKENIQLGKKSPKTLTRAPFLNTLMRSKFYGSLFREVIV